MSNIEPLRGFKVYGGLFDVIVLDKLFYILAEAKISSEDLYVF